MELKLLKEKKLKVTQQRLDILKTIVNLDTNVEFLFEYNDFGTFEFKES